MGMGDEIPATMRCAVAFESGVSGRTNGRLHDLVSLYVTLWCQAGTNRTLQLGFQTRIGPTYLVSVLLRSWDCAMESQKRCAELLCLEVESVEILTNVLPDLVLLYMFLRYQDCASRTLLLGFGARVRPTYLPSCRQTT